MSGMELEEQRVRKLSKAEQTADAMDAESKDAVKKLLENKVNSILDRDRKRVSDLFFRLDLDKSGVLTSQDFEHPIPAVQAKLQQIWGHISNEFDFNSDGIVQPDEFLAFFVLRTLMDPCPQFDQNLAKTSRARNMGNILLEWEHAFQKQFAAHIDRFEADLEIEGRKLADPAPVAPRPALFEKVESPMNKRQKGD